MSYFNSFWNLWGINLKYINSCTQGKDVTWFRFPNFISLQDNLMLRKLNTLCSKLLYNSKALLPKKNKNKKKILRSRRISWLSFFMYFNCSLSCHLKKKITNTLFYFFLILDFHRNLQVCFAYLLSSRQGLLATPWHLWCFSEIWAPCETCHSRKQSKNHACPTCPLKSQPPELLFCVLIVLSQAEFFWAFVF